MDGSSGLQETTEYEGIPVDPADLPPPEATKQVDFPGGRAQIPVSWRIVGEVKEGSYNALRVESPAAETRIRFDSSTENGGVPVEAFQSQTRERFKRSKTYFEDRGTSYVTVAGVDYLQWDFARGESHKQRRILYKILGPPWIAIDIAHDVAGDDLLEEDFEISRIVESLKYD